MPAPKAEEGRGPDPGGRGPSHPDVTHTIGVDAFSAPAHGVGWELLSRHLTGGGFDATVALLSGCDL
jgi:hypothetical protein